MTIELDLPMEQPSAERHANRMARMVAAIKAHSAYGLLDDTRCSFGCEVTGGVPGLQQHAVERALMAVNDGPGLTMPADDQLIRRATDELLRHDSDWNDGRDDDEAVDPGEYWYVQVTRVHEKVYAPLLDALLEELKTVALSWETLSGVYADTVDEHRQERNSLTNERDHLRIEVKQLHQTHGRSSQTIGQLRAELARMRDKKFDEQNKRGLAVADLVATRLQVERQSTTIRALINKVRELDATFDDTTLDGLVAAGEGR